MLKILLTFIGRNCLAWGVFALLLGITAPPFTTPFFSNPPVSAEILKHSDFIIIPECIISTSDVYKILFGYRNTFSYTLSSLVIKNTGGEDLFRQDSIARGTFQKTGALESAQTQFEIDIELTAPSGTHQFTQDIDTQNLSECAISQYRGSLNGGRLQPQNLATNSAIITSEPISEVSVPTPSQTYLTNLQTLPDPQSAIRSESALDIINLNTYQKALQTVREQTKVDLAEKYFDRPTLNSSSVIIVDDGVDFSHPMLQGKKLSEACFNVSVPNGYSSNCLGGLPASVSEGSGNPCLSVTCSHGTHIAGIIAGNDTLSGKKGINPNAQIISYAVFATQQKCPATGNCEYTDDLNVIAAYNHALQTIRDHPEWNISAINTSLGAQNYAGFCDDTYWGSIYQSIFSEFLKAGVIPVVAAGNNGLTNQVSFPACTSHSFSVGALQNSSFSPAEYSNRGEALDIFAPGTLIETATLNQQYSIVSGTSFAAPVVSGVVSLLRSVSPTMTAEKIMHGLTLNGAKLRDPFSTALYPYVDICLTTKSLGFISCSLKNDPGIPWYKPKSFW